MKLEHLALAKTDDFPIRHEGNVHSGKVRSVYWLNIEDSERIIQENNYNIYPHSQLGIMVISDRISAFNANWQGENGLGGVPGKGASLNIIAKYWFDLFTQKGFADNHIVDMPHPLVWIVQKAEPILVEAIAREYITGSLWRAYYEKGNREFCGITIPSGLKKDQRLDEIIFTPTTKGTLYGIPDVPEEEDVNISLHQIIKNYNKFGFKARKDVEKMRDLSIEGFKIISSKLGEKDLIFVDTKYELGYLKDKEGRYLLGFIDEAGNPDSSRMWTKSSYELGLIIEKSKEDFRQFLLMVLPQHREILIKGDKIVGEIAVEYKVPVEEMMKQSMMYKEMAEQITGKKMPKIENPKEEITDALVKYNIIE